MTALRWYEDDDLDCELGDDDLDDFDFDYGEDDEEWDEEAIRRFSKPNPIPLAELGPITVKMHMERWNQNARAFYAKDTTP